MPKQVIIPPGTTTPIAPFVPGTLADGVVYVSGTLPFDKQNNVVHIGDPKAQTRHVLETIKSVIDVYKRQYKYPMSPGLKFCYFRHYF